MTRTVLKAGLVYFGLVFAAGFLLGIPRVLWLVPRIGTRTAELVEAPVMLIVIVLSARWVVARYSIAGMQLARLGTGLFGLLLLMLVEFSVVVWLRQLTLRDDFSTRDPVARAIYAAMLVLFALMPFVVARGSSRQRS